MHPIVAAFVYFLHNCTHSMPYQLPVGVDAVVIYLFMEMSLHKLHYHCYNLIIQLSDNKAVVAVPNCESFWHPQ